MKRLTLLFLACLVLCGSARAQSQPNQVLVNGQAQYVVATVSNAQSQGPYFIPTASTNGTELANRPRFTSGGYLTVPPGMRVTGFKAASGQTFSTPPALVKAYITPASAAGGTDFDIHVAGTDAFYITSIANIDGSTPLLGTVIFEWILQ